MRDYTKEYEKWVQHEQMDKEMLTELEAIKDQTKEIEERFYKDLEFGTGGIRGIISAGTNRMNIYTIRKTTLGLARYIIKKGQEAMNRGVAIAHDSRRYSRNFAEEAAKVLAANNIKVYLFDELRPTPVLSFAVRELNSYSGIVITASHNPAEYNGYKVYNEHGGQLTDEPANAVIMEVEHIENSLEIEAMDLQEALVNNRIEIIGEDIDKDYVENVKTLLLNKDLIASHGKDLSMVYTPLHGTGNKLVKRILEEVGFSNLHIVEEQAVPDPNFSTVKAPNPEEREVFDLALQLANQHDAELIMATDPDADRVGVLVKIGDDYKALNGNQLGALVLHYLITTKKEQGVLPANALMVKTIVTSELGRLIATKYGVAAEDTLTGFKYIAEKVQYYEETNEKSFIFGYEESYGYLAGDFARDKDAVQLTAIVAEMALVYRQEGLTLFDKLEEIYQEFGYHVEDLVSITLKGIEGSQQIQEIVSQFRENPPKVVNDIRVQHVEDYKLQQRANLMEGTAEVMDELPKSNVIKMILEDGSWLTVRPSGTEPKIKIYFSTVGDNYNEAKAKLDSIKEYILNFANLNKSLPIK